MRQVREAVLEDRYPQFLKDFFNKLYSGKKEKYPEWAVEALRGVGVDLLSD